MPGRCGDVTGDAAVALAELPSSVQVIPAKRTIRHAREFSDAVPVICEGWAIAAVALPDGRRQILSILLPGDIASVADLFEPAYGRSVEAVTEVTCRLFRRDDVRAALVSEPERLDRLFRLLARERQSVENLAVDLGRRPAHGRVARCILHLSDRLTARGLARGPKLPFPLRQRHIADATGLTTVHVCKVLGAFQRDGLIALEGRCLTISDPDKLRRIADLL